MAGPPYSGAPRGPLVRRGAPISPPLSLVASTSDDGKTFTEAGRLDIPMAKATDPDGLQSYTVSFPETSARYLRVEARTVDSIPDWHATPGKSGFLFVDEICVN